jgi:hypothetical protein
METGIAVAVVGIGAFRMTAEDFVFATMKAGRVFSLCRP